LELQDYPINGGELINGSNMNTKYYFLHIPKAGGTTLHHILDRRFKKSEQYMYSTLYPKKSMEIIKNMSANKYNNIKLFKGHFVYGFHEWFNIDNPKYFTIMRNPIDRVMSHYLYSARKKNHYLYEKRTPTYITLYEYVKELCPEARNGMTKQISGVYVNDNFGYGKNVNHCEDQEELYELALNNIKKSFVMVGITEEFDKSLLLMKQLLGGKNIYYYYYKKNQNRNKKLRRSYSISDETKEIIAEYNKVDIKLYNYCLKKFQKDCNHYGMGKINAKYEVKSNILKTILYVNRKINRFL